MRNETLSNKPFLFSIEKKVRVWFQNCQKRRHYFSVHWLRVEMKILVDLIRSNRRMMAKLISV